MSYAREDGDLRDVLRSADPEDLAVLADYITDRGRGRLSVDNLVMSRLVAAKARNVFTDEERDLVAHEIQMFGGNAISNLARGGHGVLYREIVSDVAVRLKLGKTAEAPIEELEDAILATIAHRAWDKMSEGERGEFVRTAGLGPAAMSGMLAALGATTPASFRVSAIVANSVARQLLGRGLVVGAAAPFFQGLAVLAGPVGWVITALWAAYDLAGPGYRVTVPCTIQLSYMRKKSRLSAAQIAEV
jgi:uncharacterized protein YaaW (UPF0174 family)